MHIKIFLGFFHAVFISNLFFFKNYWVVIYYMEKAMAPHSSTLAGKIPWMEEPGGLQFMGSLRVQHDWAISLSLLLFTFMHWRRKWQPTPVFLPGESQGQGSLIGCHLLGSHRVGHDWRDLAAAAAAIYYMNVQMYIICFTLLMDICCFFSSSFDIGRIRLTWIFLYKSFYGHVWYSFRYMGHKIDVCLT